MEIERWTLDAMDDSTVTLLRARIGGRTVAAAKADAGEATAGASDLWSEEVDAVMVRAPLQEYINAAVRRSTRRPARELREGDVYIAAFREPLALDGFLRPEDTAAFIKACRKLVSRLEDGTMEARQTSKMVVAQMTEQIPSPEAPL